MFKVNNKDNRMASMTSNVNRAVFITSGKFFK